MLLAAVLPSVACESSVRWLGEALLACDGIEIARVESIQRIEGIPDVSLATLSIERSLWVADCKDQRTVLVHDGWDASPSPLMVGDRSVWFLVAGRYRPDEWELEVQMKIASLPCERLVCRVPIDSSSGEARISLPNQDWEPLDARSAVDRRGSTALREFERRLALEIRLRTPRIESDGFTIDSDGSVSWRWRPGRKMELAEDEMRSVLAAIERERFLDLPRTIGVLPRAVDAGARFTLDVRTISGRRRVSVLGYPDRTSPSDQEANRRFERVWQAIPERVTGDDRR